MSTPKYFTSYDAGAPQIVANQPQTVLNVLKAVLVGSAGTAYGSTPSCGWTVAFEDDVNHAIAFQTLGGNKRFLRLGNPTTFAPGDATQGYSYFEVRGYNAMTDVNTGTNPFPSVAQQATWRWPYACMLASASTSTVNIPWMIMASDRFMYITFQSSNGGGNYGSRTAQYFGDIYSYSAADTMQTIITGDWAATYNNGGAPCFTDRTQWNAYVPFKSSASNTNWDNYTYMYGSANQQYGPVVAQLEWNITDATGNAGYGNLPNPAPNGQFIYIGAQVHENSTAYNVRGQLPGLAIPCHTRPFPDQYILTMNGNSYVVWMNESSPGSNAAYHSFSIALNKTTWVENVP